MNNTSIQIILTFVSSFLVITSIVLFVTMSVNSKSYKYYRVTYYAIKNCNYIMVRNSFYQQSYLRPQETNLFTNDEIIFFLNRNGEVDDIKLLSIPSENHYIHSKGGIDLYARYWFKKIINAKDKYNNELHHQRRCDDMVEDVTGNNFYVNSSKPSFKFFKG